MFKSINKVIKTLVFYDLVFLFGWGLISPIFAIFIVKNIQGGDVRVAGIAVGIYWLFKSLIQLPIGSYLDKKHGERDDYYCLIGGTLISSFVPFGYLFTTLPWQIYLLQIIQAIGMAMIVPAWGGIFHRHMDKNKEAQSWALDSSALGIGTGLAGIVGGMVAKTFGFSPLFVAIGIFGIISALLCLFIKKELSSKGEAILISKPK